MKDFFEGIQYFFEKYAFVLYDLFRSTENWWTANIINWLFVIIGFVAMVYWILQLKIFNENNEENKEISAHSYL